MEQFNVELLDMSYRKSSLTLGSTLKIYGIVTRRQGDAENLWKDNPMRIRMNKQIRHKQRRAKRLVELG